MSSSLFSVILCLVRSITSSPLTSISSSSVSTTFSLMGVSSFSALFGSENRKSFQNNASF